MAVPAGIQTELTAIKASLAEVKALSQTDKESVKFQVTSFIDKLTHTVPSFFEEVYK